LEINRIIRKGKENQGLAGKCSPEKGRKPKKETQVSLRDKKSMGQKSKLSEFFPPWDLGIEGLLEKKRWKGGRAGIKRHM